MVSKMEVVYGKFSDMDSWMNLVNNVRWNFPGLETAASLEEHKKTVLKFMDKSSKQYVSRKKTLL